MLGFTMDQSTVSQYEQSEQHCPQVPHTYSPIPDDGTIRLLVLQPGAPSEPLRCRLFTANISTNPRYEAISYEWGDVTRRSSIMCDGKHRSITMNSDISLRRFRKTNEPRVLWIDALCINQEDDAEKSHQVAMMGEVYRKAETVLAWLGPDAGGHAKRAFELIEMIISVVIEQLKYFRFSELPRLKSDHPIREAKASWYSLTHFGRHNFFDRAWIVQELGLPKCVILHWGDSKVRWDSLGYIFWFFITNFDLLTVDGVGMSKVLMFRAIYGGIDAMLPPRRIEDPIPKAQLPAYFDNFWKVLDRTRSFTCSDPRDKVYAYLSHPSAFDPVSGKPIVIPDYTKSAEQIYHEVAISGLRSGASAVLSSIYHSSDSLVNRRLPTWVPNYANFNALERVISRSRGFNMGARLRLEVALGDFDTKVCLRGLVFDLIEQITVQMPTRECSPLGSLNTSAGSCSIGRIMEFVKETDATRVYPSMSVDLITSLLTTSENIGNKRVTETNLHTHMANFYSFCAQQQLSTSDSRGSLTEAEVTAFAKRGNPVHFHENLFHYSLKVFSTQEGYMGLAPPIAEQGDIICVLFGCKIPFILRAEGDHYLLLGGCYVLAGADGERIRMMKNGELQAQVFEIH